MKCQMEIKNGSQTTFVSEWALTGAAARAFRGIIRESRETSGQLK